MTVFHPVTLYLSKHFIYKANSLLQILDNPSLNFIDAKASQELFLEMSEQVYLPILQFLDSENTKFNLVVTGDFLQSSSPKIKKLIQKLIASQNLNLVAEAFYGNSLTSLYNTSWWAESIARTIKICQQELDVKPEMVYLPQVFRKLELEKIYWDQGIFQFLCRQKGLGTQTSRLKLSALRRFDKNSAYWITPENDVVCDFNFVSNNRFFDVNQSVLESQESEKLKTTAKILSLQIAMTSLIQESRSNKKSPNTLSAPEKERRLNERYSLALYSPLERAVIRLWEYGSILISTELNNRPELSMSDFMSDFIMLQNTAYLYYLDPKNYAQETLSFGSPYEAMLAMQAAVKQVEFYLWGQI
jgi:hypothetical protein